MYTIRTALAIELVKDHERELHRIAGNTRRHREAVRARQRRRR